MSEDHHLGEDLALLALDDPEAAAKHAGHLAGCADCRRAVEESRRVMVALAMPIEAPSPAFDRALRAQLDAVDAAAARSWKARLGAWWGAPAWGLAGAAAAACAVALYVNRAPDTDGASSSEVAVTLAAVDDVELAENLDLLGDLELVEELDAIEDLDAIETLEAGSPG